MSERDKIKRIIELLLIIVERNDPYNLFKKKSLEYRELCKMLGTNSEMNKPQVPKYYSLLSPNVLHRLIGKVIMEYPDVFSLYGIRYQEALEHVIYNGKGVTLT